MGDRRFHRRRGREHDLPVVMGEFSFRSKRLTSFRVRIRAVACFYPNGFMEQRVRTGRMSKTPRRLPGVGRVTLSRDFGQPRALLHNPVGISERQESEAKQKVRREIQFEVRLGALLGA